MSQDGLVINEQITLPMAELTLRACRSSGPGGQHVNKTSTKVQLLWSPLLSSALDEETRSLILTRLRSRMSKTGFITISVDEFRSQQKNITLARQRLCEMIQRALLIPKERKPTRPSRASKERRLKQKRSRSQIKAQRSTKDWT